MGKHVVQSGDTLWGIAKANGVTVDDLVRWNNISNPDVIQVGQEISLSADGGSSTGGASGTSNTNSGFTYDKFVYDDYTEGSAVTNASNALDTHLAQKPGEYQSQWQTQLNDVMDKILNREEFSYDLNGDALYQQYKDKYIKQGKMAMGDAIGQASAMTGGYGNSYAQSVGQQAYQAQLDNLNDIVPELYQMAYDKYNQEGQDLYNQFSMLGAQDDRDYGRYRDSVGDWQTDRNYLTNRYDSERDFDYGKYADDRNFAYGQYSDDRGLAYNEHRNAIEDGQWQTAFDYQVGRDKILDEQWQKEFDEATRQFNVLNEADAQIANDSVKSYSGTTQGGKNYNNGGLTNGQIKELQAALGVTADGYYGDKSKEKAGGLSAKEAYAKYVGGSSNNTTANTEQKDWELAEGGGGGINWFGGIDNNAKVVSPYDGKTYKLGDLYDEAVKQNIEAGMEKSEAKASAKAWVLSIQNKVGA